MNPQQPQQPGGQPRQLNLQQVAGQLMAGLQRHFDMLAFNLAAQEAVTDEAYENRAKGPKIMPAAPVHQNFEQMQAYARDLMQRSVLNDILNLSFAAMNNCHLFLAAIKAQKEHGQSQEAQQQANLAQQAFGKAQLDAKFNTLEEEYGLLCELEDTLISVGFAMQAIAQHGGVVQASHLDDAGELGFDLKVLEVLNADVEGAPPQGRLVDQRKSFREGDTILFTADELQLLLLTTASFFDQLFKATARYAQENNPNPGGQQAE